jgi:hypothetical protein
VIALVVGLSSLAIGLAYVGLGLLSAWETISLHRYRGWSRFGLGFSLMAASCGPHHLTHGWHALQGGSVSWPMSVASLIGLPAGLIFVWLRLEAMWGGQCDRQVAASPKHAMLLAGAFTVMAGWLAAWAYAQPPADFSFRAVCTSAGIAGDAADPETEFGFASVTFLANIFVTITYGMVGWYLAGHQVRSRLSHGAWSLSGVALSGVFFTCAQMHLIDATARGGGWMLVFDLIGIPASLYFLRVVTQVHDDSVMDWNRRQLVGAAAAPARPSPWSGDSMQP